MKHVPFSRKGDQNPAASAPLPTGAITTTHLEISPTFDEVSQEAYNIYLNEGSPQGRDAQHWLKAETQLSAARKILQARRLGN